jgi:hypothetical protein
VDRDLTRPVPAGQAGSWPGAGPDAPPAPVRRGAAPLPQALALAPLLRRVAGLALALEAEEPAVEALIGHLTAAEEALRGLVPADCAPRMAAAGGGEAGGRPYLDHSHDIGAYNPCFPEYEIMVAGEHATGRVEFPLAFEGPPGAVHGGALSLFFDAIIQHHNCELGIAGKTVSLHVDYHRPAPLLRPLEFEVRRTATGSHGTSEARLHEASRVYCTATVVAVAGDVSRLPPVSPRRAAGGSP